MEAKEFSCFGAIWCNAPQWADAHKLSPPSLQRIAGKKWWALRELLFMS